jgi:hypothetical protein
VRRALRRARCHRSRRPDRLFHASVDGAQRRAHAVQVPRVAALPALPP